MVLCTICGFDNSKYATICFNCGTRIETHDSLKSAKTKQEQSLICTKCGFENSKYATICYNCGKRFKPQKSLRSDTKTKTQDFATLKPEYITNIKREEKRSLKRISQQAYGGMEEEESGQENFGDDKKIHTKELIEFNKLAKKTEKKYEKQLMQNVDGTLNRKEEPNQENSYGTNEGIKCTKCGFDNSKYATICFNCGTRFRSKEKINQEQSLRDQVIKNKSYIKLGHLEEHVEVPKDFKDWYESILVEIAQSADTNIISSDENYEYLKSEFGINVIVPKGEIVGLRFRIDFYSDDNSEKIMVHDGFPNDIVKYKPLEGNVTIAINEAFRIVPIAGDLLANMVKIELGPWEFNLANLRKSYVQFSGAKSNFVEWLFNDMRYMDDIRFVLTIRKPISAKKLIGKARVVWKYKSGFLNTPEVASQVSEIKII